MDKILNKYLTKRLNVIKEYVNKYECLRALEVYNNIKEVYNIKLLKNQTSMIFEIIGLCLNELVNCCNASRKLYLVECIIFNIEFLTR